MEGLDGFKTKLRWLQAIEATKQTAATFAKLGAAMAACAALMACAAAKISTPMGEMSESAYVHLETVKTVATQNTAQKSCFDAVGTIGGASLQAAITDPAIAAVNAMAKVAGITGCASGASMQQAQIPQYVPPKSGWEIAADVGKTAIQYVVPGAVAIRQSSDNKEVALGAQNAGVAIAQSSDAREVGVMQATTRSSERIATAGFDATAAAARAASEAAQSAALAQAQAAQAQADAIAALPPTTQTIAGGNITQAGGDVDQSATGRDRDVVRNTNCNALGGSGAPATAGNNSATGGATSPFTAGYSPFVTGGDGASGANNCGGG
jgi:hypothetical protein